MHHEITIDNKTYIGVEEEITKEGFDKCVETIYKGINVYDKSKLELANGSFLIFGEETMKRVHWVVAP